MELYHLRLSLPNGSLSRRYELFFPEQLPIGCCLRLACISNFISIVSLDQYALFDALSHFSPLDRLDTSHCPIYCGGVQKKRDFKKKKKPRANNQKQGPRERMKGANKKCGLFFIQNDNKIIKPCLETCYRVCQPDFTRSVPSKPPHTLALFTLFFFGRAPREFKQHTRFFDDHLLF